LKSRSKSSFGCKSSDEGRKQEDEKKGDLSGHVEIAYKRANLCRLKEQEEERR
jgi:hypothetical protein